MPALLSKEQLLLINNLMYLENNGPLHELKEGQTIGECLKTIDLSKIETLTEYTSFTQGWEWKNIITAVLDDPQVSNLVVSKTHKDAKYGGTNCLLTSPDRGEAIVAFRGTATAEWKDNLISGGPTDRPDGVSTECQERALNWYQSLDLDSYQNITVTGHSKGGNKSQYIAILDDSVDRCVSFDGQGFSDEFFKKYTDQISLNQSKVTNCSEEGDFVNFLLNSVGEQKYYKGNYYGDNAPLVKKHMPETILQFNDYGEPTMVEGEQSNTIKEMDKFLNSYLNAEPDKSGALNMMGDLVQNAQNGCSAETLIGILTDKGNKDNAAFLLAYLFAYQEEHPEFQSALKDFLEKAGNKTVNKAMSLLKDMHDEDSMYYYGNLLKATPTVAVNWMTGLSLTGKQINELLDTLSYAGELKGLINTSNARGEDKSLRSPSGPANPSFHIDTQSVRSAAGQLSELAVKVNDISQNLDSLIDTLSGSLQHFRRRLEREVARDDKYSRQLETYADDLETIAEKYITTESNNTSMF